MPAILSTTSCCSCVIPTTCSYEFQNQRQLVNSWSVRRARGGDLEGTATDSPILLCSTLYCVLYTNLVRISIVWGTTYMILSINMIVLEYTGMSAVPLFK